MYVNCLLSSCPHGNILLGFKVEVHVNKGTRRNSPFGNHCPINVTGQTSVLPDPAHWSGYLQYEMYGGSGRKIAGTKQVATLIQQVQVDVLETFAII